MYTFKIQIDARRVKALSPCLDAALRSAQNYWPVKRIEVLSIIPMGVTEEFADRERSERSARRYFGRLKGARLQWLAIDDILLKKEIWDAAKLHVTGPDELLRFYYAVRTYEYLTGNYPDTTAPRYPVILPFTL